VLADARIDGYSLRDGDSRLARCGLPTLRIVTGEELREREGSTQGVPQDPTTTLPRDPAPRPVQHSVVVQRGYGNDQRRIRAKLAQRAVDDFSHLRDVDRL
jgi:hypothetical protein